MPLRTVSMSSFQSLASAMLSTDSIFIIPTFQRPYAWAYNHVEDLLNDITMATTRGSHHYFGTIHLIKIPQSTPLSSWQIDAATPGDAKQLDSSRNASGQISTILDSLWIYTWSLTANNV